jgi:hypothetical protein
MTQKSDRLRMDVEEKHFGSSFEDLLLSDLLAWRMKGREVSSRWIMLTTFNRAKELQLVSFVSNRGWLAGFTRRKSLSYICTATVLNQLLLMTNHVET